MIYFTSGMQGDNKNSSALPDVLVDCISTTFPYRQRTKNAQGALKQPVQSLMHTVYTVLLCVNSGGIVFLCLSAFIIWVMG